MSPLPVLNASSYIGLPSVNYRIGVPAVVPGKPVRICFLSMAGVLGELVCHWSRAHTPLIDTSMTAAFIGCQHNLTHISYTNHET